MLVLVLAMVAAGSTQASAAAPYEFDPTLSLTGSCSTSVADPIADPGCPYPTPGGPTGPFDRPRVVAIDPVGNEYIGTSGDLLDIFDDEGHFISEMAIKDVQNIAVDSKGHLYVLESTGSVVRYDPSKYEPETGKIEYGAMPVTVSTGSGVGAAVAVDPSNDQVFEARQGTIIRRRPASQGNTELESFEPQGSGPWTSTISVDGQSRRIYLSYCQSANTKCGVMALEADGAHTVLKELTGASTPAGKFLSASGWLAIAVDEETGDFFVADIAAKLVYQFDKGYAYVSQFSFSDLQVNTPIQIAVSNGKRSLPKACKYPTNPVPPPGDACNRHYLFVPAWVSPGSVAAYHPSNQDLPVIESVAVAGIGETEAELKATIFPSGLATEYSFQITTQAAWEAETEKFESATTIPGGTISSVSLATEVGAFATGLVPGETYRFRAVAGNNLGKAAEEGQNEATFATYKDASITSPGGCPNEVLRVNASALLPDCRAYELVTPADTSGRPPKGTGVLGSVFSTLQASPAGDAVSFKIEGGSLPGGSGIGSFFGDPYVSRRNTTGWNTELAGATGAESTKSAPGSVSPDQGYAFWSSEGEGPLGPEGGAIANEYFYYPDGHSELIGRGSEGTEPVAVGELITEDATHVVFRSVNLGFRKAIKLEPNAPPEGTTAVYDRTIGPKGEEKTHVVSLLPGDITPGAGQSASYQGASGDGEGIAFSIGKELYLRVNNESTYEIGEEVEFAGVSEGGERIFYVEGGDLKAFDVASEEEVEFSETGNVTPVNVSTDGTRAYFVSPSVLGGTNPQGDEAQAGKQNLYLSEEGTISFVATVTERDVEGEVPAGETNAVDGLGVWTDVVDSQPAKDPSRTNPDGSVLLFQSRAEITGYPASEFPQIYRYDGDAEDLQCISCIPTKMPASSGASLESYTLDTFTPKPFSPYGFTPNLTPDGRRAFFESTEALVSTDTDKVNDVYEWEAKGIGSCEQPDGCVYLISSGASQRANYLYGHSTDGRDVFFTTGDALTGWDSTGGAISIYDARVGGGFPEPEPDEPCVGDACFPPATPAPDFGKPEAGGNGDALPKAKPCPKGKHKVKKNGKVRCVKKKPKKHKSKGGKAKQRAGADRGAGR